MELEVRSIKCPDAEEKVEVRGADFAVAFDRYELLHFNDHLPPGPRLRYGNPFFLSVARSVPAQGGKQQHRKHGDLQSPVRPHPARSTSATVHSRNRADSPPDTRERSRTGPRSSTASEMR